MGLPALQLAILSIGHVAPSSGVLFHKPGPPRSPEPAATRRTLGAREEGANAANVSADALTVIFIAGLEGAGHDVVEMLWQSAFGKFKNIIPMPINYKCGATWTNDIKDTIADAMNSADSRQRGTLWALPLNMPYPDCGGASHDMREALSHPSIDHLQEAADAAGVNLAVIFLHRHLDDCLAVSCLRNNIESCGLEAETLEKNAAFLVSQLEQVPRQKSYCLDIGMSTEMEKTIRAAFGYTEMADKLVQRTFEMAVPQGFRRRVEMWGKRLETLTPAQNALDNACGKMQRASLADFLTLTQTRDIRGFGDPGTAEAEAEEPAPDAALSPAARKKRARGADTSDLPPSDTDMESGESEASGAGDTWDWPAPGTGTAAKSGGRSSKSSDTAAKSGGRSSKSSDASGAEGASDSPASDTGTAAKSGGHGNNSSDASGAEGASDSPAPDTGTAAKSGGRSSKSSDASGAGGASDSPASDTGMAANSGGRGNSSSDASGAGGASDSPAPDTGMAANSGGRGNSSSDASGAGGASDSPAPDTDTADKSGGRGSNSSDASGAEGASDLPASDTDTVANSGGSSSNSSDASGAEDAADTTCCVVCRACFCCRASKGG